MGVTASLLEVTPDTIIRGNFRAPDLSVGGISGEKTSIGITPDIVGVTTGEDENDTTSDETISIDAVTLTSPGNQTVRVDIGTVTFSWGIDTDESNAANRKYDIYQNGTRVVEQQGWVDGGTIDFNFSPPSADIFNITVVATTKSSTATDTIFVDVINNIEVVKVPGDKTFSNASSQNFVEWVYLDDNPRSYTIYRNGTIQAYGGWQSEIPIGYNVDATALNISNYNYTIVLDDYDGNVVNNTIIVTITTVPVLVDKTQKLVFDNESDFHSLYWTFTDSDPDTYEIYNTTTHLIDSGSWTPYDPITLGLTGLSNGIYNYSLRVNDTDNQYTWSNISITVTDRPTILSAPEPNLTVSETDIIILQWTATDSRNDTYSISINGSTEVTGTWEPEVPITFDISYLVRNIYNISIYFFDEDGLDAVNSTIVSVKDDLAPVIEGSPSNMDASYTEGTILLSYTVSDAHPQNYSIYVNSALEQQGSWLSTIEYNFVIGEIGIYNVTAIFSDDSNNSTKTQFNLTISDNLSPVILNSPEDNTLEVNSELRLSWSLSDLEPGTYSIKNNQSGSIIQEGNWLNNISIDYNSILSSIGTIEFSLTVFDLSGNSLSDIVVIDVIPIQTVQPIDDDSHLLYSGDQLTFRGDWVEYSGIGVVNGQINARLTNSSHSSILDLDFTTSTNGSFEFLLHHNDLTEGNYVWEISFLKEQYQGWQIQIELEIVWHSVFYEIDLPDTISQGQEMDMKVTIQYNDISSAGISPDNLVPRSGPASDISFQISLTLHYLNRSKAPITLPGETQENGQDILTIQSETTQNLKSFEGISLSLLSGNSILLSSEPTNSFDMPHIKANSFVNWFWLIFDFHPGLVFILGSIMLAKPVYIRLKMAIRKLYKKFANEQYKFYAELSSISSILVFNNNGILFYSKQFDTGDNIDPSLIAALSTAITTFLGEIESGQNEKLGFHKMEKQDFSITIHSFPNSSLAFLSRVELSDKIKSHIRDIHAEIESEFEAEFSKGYGGLDRLEERKIANIMRRNELPIDLLSSISFRRDKVLEIIYNRYLPVLLGIELRDIMDQSQGKLDGKTFSYHELVQEFAQYGIGIPLAGKMVFQLYDAGAFDH